MSALIWPIIPKAQFNHGHFSKSATGKKTGNALGGEQCVSLPHGFRNLDGLDRLTRQLHNRSLARSRGMMTSIWRSLMHVNEATAARNLLAAIQEALLEAFCAADGSARALSLEEIAPIKALCDQLTPAHCEWRHHGCINKTEGSRGSC